MLDIQAYVLQPCLAVQDISSSEAATTNNCVPPFWQWQTGKVNLTEESVSYRKYDFEDAVKGAELLVANLSEKAA